MKDEFDSKNQMTFKRKLLRYIEEHEHEREKSCRLDFTYLHSYYSYLQKILMVSVNIVLDKKSNSKSGRSSNKVVEG